MAVSTLIEQHVIFISSSGSIDETGILANSLVQSMAANSAGQDIIMGWNSFQHWTGTAWVPNSYFEIKCYVTAAFQTTIQSNIPNLQAAFPQYQIVTWGGSVAFGN